MKKSLALFGALTLVVEVLITGCSPKLGSQKQDPAKTVTVQKVDGIPIGMAISLKGGTALYGEAAKRGADLAVEEFNAAGGYQGKKVSLIVNDDEANPEKSTAIVKQMIDQYHVVALIGPANTENALAHIQLAQDAKVPEVIPVASGTQITQKFAKSDKNYIFRVALPDNVQVSKILEQMVVKDGYRRIGLIHDTGAFGQGGKEDVLRLMKEKYKIQPTVISTFNPQDTNLEKQVLEMKNAGVQAFIFYGQAPQGAGVLEARNKQNIKIPVYAPWIMGDPGMGKLAGTNVNNNVFFADFYSTNRTKQTKELHDKVMAKYKEDIFPALTAQGYDSTRLILEALKKVGPNGEKIRDEIEKTSNFQGVTAIGRKPFSRTNHEAYGTGDTFIATYKQGTITVLK